MSVTTFIKEPNVKNFFKENFTKPSGKFIDQVLVPPSTNPQLVGTSFDYLFRFYIRHMNKSKISSKIDEKKWLADKGYEIIKQNKKIYGEKNVKIGQNILNNAKKQYLFFCSNGILTDDLISSTLQLAQLDNVYRSGGRLPTSYDFGDVDRNDVENLRKLINLVNIDRFKAKNRIKLNPTFNRSEAIGGADADLIIDDMLIEIKTTQSDTIPTSDFNQVLAYVLLHDLDIKDECKKSKSDKKNQQYRESNLVNKIGIYYSRRGSLQILNLYEITNKGKFSNGFDLEILDSFEKEILQYQNILDLDFGK